MLLFEKHGIITAEDDKTNISFAFDVPENVNMLKIKYFYNPKEVENQAQARHLVEEAMHKYGILDYDADSALPVKNLITLSFDENGEYRGACHRQPNRQIITIAEKDSTPGIINRPVQAGKWNVVMNVHYSGCNINYSIEIEGKTI